MRLCRKGPARWRISPENIALSFELEIAIVFLCLALGGVLKGATGAGAPLLAVPALALFFDVQFAVVTMLVSNVLTNIWQAWSFRTHLPPRPLVVRLLVGAIIGVFAGSVLLVTLPMRWLSLAVAAAVLAYIALRLLRPGWRLSMERAIRLSLPVGLFAGLLQGASGLSGPASLTYFNAMRLERNVFISVVAMLFVVMSSSQTIALAFAGVLTLQGLAISTIAFLAVVLGMPVGSWLARRMPAAAFDRAILLILAVIGLKLIYDGIMG